MRARRFPYYPQLDGMDCGGACLRMVAACYGRSFSGQEMQRICAAGREGVSVLSVCEAAEAMGFRAVAGRVSLEKLTAQQPFPCILHWNQEHFVVLYAVRKRREGERRFCVADPGKGMLSMDEETFKEHWLSTRRQGEDRGIVVSLQPTVAFFEQHSARGKKVSSAAFLYGYVRPYGKFFLHLAAGLLLGSILQLIAPFLTQAIVDTGIANRDIGFIYLVLAGQLMLVLSSTAIDFVRRWILLHISVRVNLSLLSDFIIKLMKLPMGFFEAKQIGDLMQRMNDHERVQQFLTTQTLGILYSLFSFVIFGAVLLYYDVWIFAVFALGSLLYAGWIGLFLRRRRTIDYEYFEQRARNQSKTMQLLSGMQEIKLQGCESRRRWEWEDVQAGLFQVNMKSLKLSQAQEVGGVFINQAKNIVITIMAATAVVDGRLSLGMMLAIQYILGQLSYPVEQLLAFIYHWQDVKISLERMTEIHVQDNESEGRNTDSPVPDSPAAIDVENVSFRYEGKHSPKVLDHVTLHIPQGKMTAIVGGSGSGKTTLVKLLLGYYAPTEGNIRVDGTDLAGMDKRKWRRQCGVVMQDGYIFSESIARNIAVDDGEVDKQKLAEAARVACVDEFAERLPLKYDTTIGMDGRGISQGQRQRILIARAVYKDPPFLFFDEATNALDTVNERVIMENLDAFYKGKTVVVVAHRLSTVRHADQIVVLDKGRVVETGTHEELAARKGAYFHLVKNQLELGG